MSLGNTMGRFSRTRRRSRRERWRDFNQQRAERQRVEQTEPVRPFREAVPTLEWAFRTERIVQTIQHCARHKGQATGIDGVCWDDLTISEIWRVADCIREAVLSGNYCPRLERVCLIPKLNGGTRPLSIRAIADRVVATIINDILVPYCDQFLSDISLAYRPNRTAWDLLAHLEYDVVQEQRYFFADDDLQQAFEYVPIRETLVAFAQHVNPEWLQLIEQLLRGHHGNDRGIAQGCPLSPLAMNLFADTAHDRYCESLEYGARSYRFSDDTVYTCHDSAQLKTHVGMASAQLARHGMTFKGTAQHEVTIHDIRLTPLTKLGFVIKTTEETVSYDISEKGWLQLAIRLRETHGDPNARRLAADVIRGLIASKGPAFNRSAEHVAQLQRLLEQEGFSDLLSEDQCCREMHKAHSRWLQRKQEIHQQRDQRQRTLDTADSREALKEAAAAPRRLNRPARSACRPPDSAGAPSPAAGRPGLETRQSVNPSAVRRRSYLRTQHGAARTSIRRPWQTAIHSPSLQPEVRSRDGPRCSGPVAHARPPPANW